MSGLVEKLKNWLLKTSDYSHRIESRRYWVIVGGSRVRCYSFFSLNGIAQQTTPFREGRGDNIPRITSFFNAMLRSKIPVVYLVTLKPSTSGVFESTTVIGTWSEGDKTKLAECLARVEEQSRILSTALSVAYPSLVIKRLEGSSLSRLVDCIWVRDMTDNAERASSEHVASKIGAIGSVAERDAVAPAFHIPKPDEIPVKGLRLGSLISEGAERGEIRLGLEDLSRHVCILGMTGSGKTTTAKLIIKRLFDSGVPCLVLDVHNEYSRLVRRLGGLVLDPGRGEFSINPIDLSEVTELSEHISLLTDIFSEIYRFTPPQAYMFRNAITKLLTSQSDAKPPTIQELVEILETMPVKSIYYNETRLALLRRLVPLTEGQAWKILGGPTTMPVNELINNLVAIELGYIRDSDTRLVFATLLLKMIRDHLIKKGHDSFSHVIVIEEARYLVPSRRNDLPPSVTEKMISELRKFGASVVLISQFPSQISSEVIKNSSLRIIHRVSWADDIRVLRDSLNLTEEQARYLSMLDVGEAIVVSRSTNKPMLVKIDPQEIFELEKSLSTSTAKTDIS